MKFPASFILLIVAGLFCQAGADTLKLKDGTTYEGKILREDADSYTMEVQVTRTIKDERTFKKADVASTTREQPDQKEFEEIRGLTPTPDLLTPANYDARLEKVYAFIQGHKEGLLGARAKLIAADLENERDAVSAGGVKLGGHLIKAKERQANKFEVDARMIEISIRRHADASEWLAALREFQTLEADYQSSLSYRELLPLVRKIVARYRSDAAANLASFDQRLKERAIGLDRMAPDDRKVTVAAIAEQDAAAKRLYDSEKKDGTKWITPSPDLKDALTDAVKVGDLEAKRLDEVNPDALPDGGKAWRDVFTAVSKGADASAPLAEARAAKLPDRYLSELEAATRKVPAAKK